MKINRVHCLQLWQYRELVKEQRVEELKLVKVDRKEEWKIEYWINEK